MQGSQHQVAGQAGLHGDLRRFHIADLAYHDDVGILPQNGAQGLGKAHVDARIHLGLRYLRQIVFDRVFHRHDIERGGIHARQRRIQRGGLAGTGRPGDQDDAVRLVDQAIDIRQCGIAHAQAGQVHACGIFLQDAQHRTLAMPGRQCRNADIHGLARYPQGDAAVLRQAFLGDIQLRHHLEARHHGGMQSAMRLDDAAHRAINAEAHYRTRFVRLDMHVGGPGVERLREDGVDHADDRGAIVRLQQVLYLRQLLHQPRQVHIVLQVTG